MKSSDLIITCIWCIAATTKQESLAVWCAPNTITGLCWCTHTHTHTHSPQLCYCVNLNSPLFWRRTQAPFWWQSTLTSCCPSTPRSRCTCTQTDGWANCRRTSSPSQTAASSTCAATKRTSAAWSGLLLSEAGHRPLCRPCGKTGYIFESVKSKWQRSLWLQLLKFVYILFSVIFYERVNVFEIWTELDLWICQLRHFLTVYIKQLMLYVRNNWQNNW